MKGGSLVRFRLIERFPSHAFLVHGRFVLLFCTSSAFDHGPLALLGISEGAEQASGVRDVCSARTRKSFTLRISVLLSGIAPIAEAANRSRIAPAGDGRFWPKSDLGEMIMSLRSGRSIY